MKDISPNNILICPDSFKDSLNSKVICRILVDALFQINDELKIRCIPMADGGEGTLDVLLQHDHFEVISHKTYDPLGRQIVAPFLWNAQSREIVIELAQASGIERLAKKDRNCMYTSTYGTGIQIRHGIQHKGPAQVYLAVGSSATNDAGLGMLAALGFDIVDVDGEIIKRPTGKDLVRVKSVSEDGDIKDMIQGVEFVIINDVDNPFCGANGAAYTYAKQKGADTEQIEMLDAGLENVRGVIQREKGIDLNKVAGSGAAGGIAGGAYAYLNATMISGINFIAGVTDLESAIESADIVITGEGKLDDQTMHGKLVKRVAEISKMNHKKLIVICGANELSEEAVSEMGINKVYALNEYNTGSYNDETTKRDLRKVVNDISRLIF